MSDVALKNAYVYIFDEMETARKTVYDLEVRTLELRRKITHLGGMLVALRENACQSCGGKGEFWVSHDQDDTKRDKCETCKGTGLA